jgi:very-short-patch-repair endonuclease/predicted transcriptional regulator of viral defense system
MANQSSARPVAANEIHIEPLSGAKGEARRLDEREYHVDRVLAELANAQHGVVGRRQLLAAGIGRRAIGGRLERGGLHLIHRGAYAVGHSALSVQGRWMAATLALGPEAVLSHRSAGELWGIVPRSSRVIEATRRTNARSRLHIVTHQSSLLDDERTVVDGIPVTTVPRTILDLAAVVSRRQLERALNEVEVRGLTDRLSIPDLLARHPRRRGAAVLRGVLDADAAARGVTKYALEERFVSLIDSYGLPRPRLNADVMVGGRFFSVDCLWMDKRLIVELDGRAVHGTAKAFEADRERDRLLLLDGWRVVRITWRQLRDQEATIAADVRRALNGRSGSR